MPVGRMCHQTCGLIDKYNIFVLIDDFQIACEGYHCLRFFLKLDADVVTFPHCGAGSDESTISKPLFVDEEAIWQELDLFDLPGGKAETSAQYAAEGLPVVSFGGYVS